MNTVTIGATQAEGDARPQRDDRRHSGIPFLSFDGEMPYPPALALDVFDKPPLDLAPAAGGGLRRRSGRIRRLGAAWRTWVRTWWIFASLGTHPDEGDGTANRPWLPSTRCWPPSTCR